MEIAFVFFAGFVVKRTPDGSSGNTGAAGLNRSISTDIPAAE
jgi:hypothetical protein